MLTSSAVSEEDSVYRLYYDFRQPLSRVQGYQVLAINRGEKEGFLKVSIDLDREAALPVVRRHVLIPGSRSMAFVRAAAEDAYDRLLFPVPGAGGPGAALRRRPMRGPSGSSP